MTPTNADLRQFIFNRFSDDELEAFCHDYFPEVWQNFTGNMTKSRKALLMVAYGDTRGQMEKLRAALARERPDVWQQQFGVPSVETFPRNVSTPPTLTRDPRQVFISHATADADFAHRLADDLRAEGWTVWIAPESIRPGEKWVEAIERGLETSGVFVVALTPAAVASRWVNSETDAAVTMEHEGLITFIPLDVVECQPKRLWRQYQYISFRGNYEIGLDLLYKRLDAPGSTEVDVERLLAQPDKVLPGKIIQGSPPPVTPRERYVKEEQWRQLQALAHEIAAELGRQSGDDETREVFRRFNREFGLTTYKKLPRRRFGEGLAFLTRWRDEVLASAPPKPQSDAPAVTPAPPLPSPPAPFPGYRTLSADRIVHEKTGIEFVRIPAGPFLYGSADSDAMAYDDEKPQRTVDLPEYWIGRAPVTNVQYKRFLDANPKQGAPRGWNDRQPPSGTDDHPVVFISWHDAQAFCDWAGLALPTEEQWEKAARGTDGRFWPWGNEEPTTERCNFNQNASGTTPVGKYSSLGDSPFGCVDMAGNVWEWTASWYNETQHSRTVKGGSWAAEARSCRCALRGRIYPGGRLDFCGCRVLVAPSGHL